MKDIRPEFTPEEYHRLRFDADRLGVSLKQLVHDRAVKSTLSDNPLTAAQILASEISQNREVLNQIIKREPPLKSVCMRMMSFAWRWQ